MLQRFGGTKPEVGAGGVGRETHPLAERGGLGDVGPFLRVAQGERRVHRESDQPGLDWWNPSRIQWIDHASGRNLFLVVIGSPSRVEVNRMSDINALSTFPPSWWRGRQPADDAGQPPLGDHFPYARPMRTGWTRNNTGDWVASAEDPHQWEVFCEQCGDTDGPADSQPDRAREIRGPYSSKHKAEHVARRHFEDTGPRR